MVNSVKYEPIDVNSLRTQTLRFVESMCMQGEPTGRYRYSESQRIPVLYASAYAVLTRHLYKDLYALTNGEKKNGFPTSIRFNAMTAYFVIPRFQTKLPRQRYGGAGNI